MLPLPYPEIEMAVRTLVALVFLSAAVGKLRHLAVFGAVLANYRLLPEAFVAPVAHVLPPLEAVVGLALLLGLGAPWSEAAAAGLLSLFAAAMAVNIMRGRRDIDCGCFQSVLKQTLSWTLVGRNLVMVLLLGLAVMSRGGPRELWPTVDGLLVGGVSFVILQSLNILWSIVPGWRHPRRFDAGARR